MASKTGVPVTARALIQRINRALADNGEILKAPRGAQALQELGDYYILDTKRNCVTRKDVDIEAVGRTLGVLKAYEALA